MIASYTIILEMDENVNESSCKKRVYTRKLRNLSIFAFYVQDETLTDNAEGDMID